LVAEVQTVPVAAEAEVVTQLVALVCNPPLLLGDLEITVVIGHLGVMTVVEVVLEEPVDCLLVEQGARLKSSASVERMPHLRQVATETYQALPTLFLPW
jgi:hypothetical protein